MRIATFNLQNLRLRTRDGVPALDGAVDADTEAARGPDLDLADRRRTAMVLHAADPDLAALQEVFDPATLDYFHDRFLVPAGAAPYPHRICLPGNDGRGRNLAALSRLRPLAVRSHADATGTDLGLDGLPERLADRPLFRRDCLRLDLPGVTLFLCHFKAPYPDPDAALTVRRTEAAGVRRLVEAAFPDPADARWIVLGDFNEPAGAGEDGPGALEPLVSGFAVDLLDRLRAEADWTFALPDTHQTSRPDRILVSPRLAAEYPGARPVILRAGFDSSHPAGDASPDRTRPHASDHALVYVDLPRLCGPEG